MRETYGENRPAERARRPGWARFLDQFRSLLILILMGAAILAGLVGDFKDTIVIAVVLLINATLRFVQENRAERSVEALRDMLVPTARVRREGHEAIWDAAGLVPGDVVLLEAGDRVPADGRLLVAESLEVDESALTGESQPVAKSVPAVLAGPGEKVPLAERTCMAFSNTSLTRGRAGMVVTTTGMSTEVGAIAQLLQDGKEPATPLQVQLDAVGKRIALIGRIAVATYAILAVVRGESLGEVALTAVALAVAAVPEGVPAVLALTLALGVGRMARHGAVVLCNDAVLAASADGAAGPGMVGDPTEGALVVAATKAGIDVTALRLAARSEHDTVFARHTLTNRWLWSSLATIAVLQLLAV